MATPKPRVQYPELNGSEQHFDLKNDPGKAGDPDHAEDTKDISKLDEVKDGEKK